METPVSAFPLIMVRCIGAAPRYSGSKDGCMFNRKEGSARSRIEEGIALPNDAVIIELLDPLLVEKLGCIMTLVRPRVFQRWEQRTFQEANSSLPEGISCTGTFKDCARSFKGAVEYHSRLQRTSYKEGDVSNLQIDSSFRLRPTIWSGVVATESEAHTSTDIRVSALIYVHNLKVSRLWLNAKF